MSNNKQSSVEQFAIALYDNGLLQGNGNQIDDLLLHFKAMHKEEHRETWDECLLSSNPEKTFEDHYNKTFGDESNN